VLPGETLSSISKRYKVKAKKILKASDLKSPSDVYAGTVLFIPKAKKVLRAPDTEALKELARQDPGFCFDWPLREPPTSFFGERQKEFHTGIDIPTSRGTILISAAAGVVASVRDREGYGLTIVVENGNGYTTLYAHLSRVFVQEGQEIKKGQAIGAVGSSGNATGNHLHFEILKDGVPVDPLLLLPDRGKQEQNAIPAPS
jgi:murein DD-endopeptidase MepM/ murein hydrolase activator NlpD